MNRKFCIVCNNDILKKHYARHERTQKHLNNLRTNSNNINLIDEEISNSNIPHPIKPLLFKPPVKESKDDFEKIKQEILNEFDDLIKNYREVPKEVLMKELKNVFTNIKTNKRNFDSFYFEDEKYLVRKSEEALEGCFLTLRIEMKQKIENIEVLTEDLPEILFPSFKDILTQRKGIKLQAFLMGSFYNRLSDENKEISVLSKNIIILNAGNIKNSIVKLINEIREKIEAWDNNEAYWHLKRVLFIDFKLREYKPLRGSSYIPTPVKIDSTKSIINIQNKEDNKCFKYCILYGLFKDEINNHPERVTHYKKKEMEYPQR
jgi:hypothetical protein